MKNILECFLEGFLQLFENNFDDKMARGDNKENLKKDQKVKNEDFKKYINILKKTVEFIQKFGEKLFENLPNDPESKAPTMKKLEKISFLFDTFSSAELIDLKWDLSNTKDYKINSADDVAMNEDPPLVRKLFKVQELRLLYCIAFPESTLPSFLVYKPYKIIE